MNPDPNDQVLIPAATVVLLRDEADSGLEVLMLRRNSKLAFGGMWVFPGGRVDAEEMLDGDVLGSARVAAVRETEEETGLEIRGDSLLTWSYWEPPLLPSVPTKGPRRRFSTWFFVGAAPAGAVAIDHGEIHEDRWLSPGEALSQHRAGDIELVPPTWITLTQLSAHNTVAEAMSWASNNEPEKFCTKPISKDPMTICWAGDAAYENGNAETAGDRHRLVMQPGDWSYQRSAS